MSNVKQARKALGIVALAALSTLSCKGFLDGGGSPPATGDNGSITTSDPATTNLTPIPAGGTPAEVVPVPTGTKPETTPAAPIETPAALPSPAVLEAVNTAQVRLNGLTTGVQGTSVKFVDCTEAATCSGRLEATSLAGLRDLLQSVSKDQGGIGFVAREQLDAYTGQKFVADVTLGGTNTRPVPTDENELLVNNDAPAP